MLCFTVSGRVKSLRDTVPIILEGEEVYRIGEALELAGLSRSTYYRWVREGRIADTDYRDRNGRRVFTRDELENLCSIAQQLLPASPQMALLKRRSTDG